MQHPLRTILVALLLMAAPVAAADEAEAGFGLRDALEDTPAPSVKPGPGQEAEALSPMEALPLRLRIAQLMVVAPQGEPVPNTLDKVMLTRYPPGGVILPSLMKPRNAAEYAADLRAMAAGESPLVPPLVGGDLHALPKYGWGPRNFFPPLPSLMAVAAANDPRATEALAGLIAEHMKLLGLNFHLGPPLELAPTLSEAEGTVQNLGSDPEAVAEIGGALLKRLLDEGIVAVPTGFPGGGLDRTGNSPAVLLTPEAHLDGGPLLPYRRAIELGVPAIHVGNVLVPTLDPDNLPASLSRVVMRGLLRDRLGFEGVVLAGPIDSPDIVRDYDLALAAQRALESGADMLLWSAAGDRVMRAVEELAAAVENGTFSQDVVDNAFQRVVAMKESFDLAGREAPDPKEADKLERKREFPRAALEVERLSITCVQNRAGTLPLTKLDAMPVGVTGVAGVTELKDALEEYLKHVAEQPITTAKHAGQIMDFEIDRVTRYIEGARTIIVVLTSDMRPRSQQALVRAIKQKGPRVVVVLAGYPSSLPELAAADAILLTYGERDVLEQNMTAVAEVLMGQGPVGILHAVRDVRLRAGTPERFSVFDVVRVPAGRLPVTIEEPFVAGYAVPYDPTHSVRRVEWRFGDGDKSKDFVTEKTFDAPGRYPITLTVRDHAKNETSRTFHAVVE